MRDLEKLENPPFVIVKLQSITIPSTVMKIGSYAFNNCTHLREVVLNDGLKKIEDSIFQNCTALQSITLPSTVDEIGSNAFLVCTSLQDVVLNEGIEMIKEHAFGGCTSLRSITIPSTVNEIKQNSFKNCTNLREVVIHNDEIQIEETSFVGCTSLQRFKFSRLYTRLDSIIQAGQRDIEAKMDDIPTVEWRGGELIIPTVSREIEDQWGIGRMETLVMVDEEKLDKVKGLIAYFEVREATTLFELAIWKAKIDQEEANMNRNAHRIEVPGPVKDTIVQYLR